MGNLLLELWSADRKAVLFVTHDLEEAIALAAPAAVPMQTVWGYGRSRWDPAARVYGNMPTRVAVVAATPTRWGARAQRTHNIFVPSSPQRWRQLVRTHHSREARAQED